MSLYSFLALVVSLYPTSGIGNSLKKVPAMLSPTNFDLENPDTAMCTILVYCDNTPEMMKIVAECVSSVSEDDICNARNVIRRFGGEFDNCDYLHIKQVFCKLPMAVQNASMNELNKDVTERVMANTRSNPAGNVGYSKFGACMAPLIAKCLADR